MPVLKISLKININKTGKEPPKIDVNGEDLKCTPSFTYLGSTVTSEDGAGKDIRCRLGKAIGVPSLAC